MMDEAKHLDDAAVVRLLDGEEAGEGDRRHLLGCPPCRSRLDELERSSRALTSALAASDAEAPEPTWDPAFLERLSVAGGVGGARVAPGAGLAQPPGAEPPAPVGSPVGAGRPTSSDDARRWLRIAAGVVLVAMLASAPPVRALVVDAIRSAWVAVRGPKLDPSAPPPGADREAGATEVEVISPGPILRVVVAGPLPKGGVVIRRGGGSRARATLTGASGSDASGYAEILVTVNGFRVTAPGTDADLQVTVPGSVREVVVESSAGMLRRTLGVPDTMWVVGPRGGG